MGFCKIGFMQNMISWLLWFTKQKQLLSKYNNSTFKIKVITYYSFIALKISAVWLIFLSGRNRKAHLYLGCCRKRREWNPVIADLLELDTELKSLELRSDYNFCMCIYLQSFKQKKWFASDLKPVQTCIAVLYMSTETEVCLKNFKHLWVSKYDTGAALWGSRS